MLQFLETKVPHLEIQTKSVQKEELFNYYYKSVKTICKIIHLIYSLKWAFRCNLLKTDASVQINKRLYQ